MRLFPLAHVEHAMRSLVRQGGLVATLLGGESLAVLLVSPVSAMTLQQAVAIAVDSNPEIGAAIENRSATSFELQQALGLYAPRVDLEASAGVQWLSNPARRAAGTDDDALFPTKVGINVSYDLYDGGFRD